MVGSAMSYQIEKTKVTKIKIYHNEDEDDDGRRGLWGKFRQKIMRSSSDVSSNREERPLPITISSPRRYTRQTSGSRHIIPADQIEAISTLGVGEFGIVQQGVWTNDNGQKIQVAIKCLSKERMQTGIADFLKEATMMHTVDHDNIVRLYGVVLDSSSEAPLMLVTELAPMRSLLECLKDTSAHPNFPVTTLCEYATQIAKGMEYLETRRMIHRDLAARNILVFSKTKVKISDFGMSRALGLSRDYYQTNFNVNLKLPIAWCAPECINYLRFTTASDVWAFGVTLWEMFSYGLQPWGGFSGQQILEAIDEPNCRRLEQPDCCPKEFYGLMLKCWENDPGRRPTFLEIAAMLPQIQPTTMTAERDSSNTGKDFLVYSEGDVVTVLDRK
ncbi:tyrosine-protein kinase PR2 isoform X1 [Lingula anatina]|uniref:non-specific protein-tyrosine kinase n=2 Tax=Lingula anatina TaxID=7574 RepID=A0A1S3IRN8_LINAN|nr:tyrosine-protein kinase PR2 isoform X1 [Lingula anatina]|eukprot:XP_013400872.1 tyrosine-protein kinase PR2 isoform X1 [Lingula anatina]